MPCPHAGVCSLQSDDLALTLLRKGLRSSPNTNSSVGSPFTATWLAPNLTSSGVLDVVLVQWASNPHAWAAPNVGAPLLSGVTRWVRPPCTSPSQKIWPAS